MYLYVHCGSSAPAATRSERRSGATNDFPSWRGERPAVLGILMYLYVHCGSSALAATRSERRSGATNDFPS